MKTLTFTYTKKDGSTSERTLLATVTPGDKYAGIDLTMLEPSDAAHFVGRAKQLHDDYVSDMQELQAQFDLKYNYRQFLSDGVSDLTEIN
jgi:hypothetical protein